MAGRKKGKWSRRSQSEWRSLLARFSCSGMGVEAFCRREAISAASFYRWRSLLSDGRSVDGGDPPPSDARVRRSWHAEFRIVTQAMARSQARSRRRSDSASGAQLMFFPEGQVRVHVYGRPVDMRKSYDGLYALTRQELGQDPLEWPTVRVHQPPRDADEGALLGPHRFLPVGASGSKQGRFLSDWREVTTREMDWTGLKLLLEGIEAKVRQKALQTPPWQRCLRYNRCMNSTTATRVSQPR